MTKLDANAVAAAIEGARDRYARTHRQGSMATVCAAILFDALRDDVLRTGLEQATTAFSRAQLRERMRAHPAWEGKAFEESSFNTVPEDLGDQLTHFVHEQPAAGSMWRFTFRGPTRKFRKDQTSRELFLEVAYEPVGGVGEPAPPPPKTKRSRWWWSAAVVAIILAAVSTIIVRRGVPRPVRPNVARSPLTIGVLPLRLLGVDPQLSFLGTAIADAVTTRLSNLPQLRVRPTSTILKYQTADDVARAGRELSADYLLSGTLQEAGDQLRVGVQLIRVTSGAAVWGSHVDVPRGNLLSVEDEVATRVAEALQLRLTSADRARFERLSTKNPRAYEAYLRGRASMLSLTKAGTEAAIAAFRSAVAIDPQFALAHAGLASACAQMRIRFAPKAEVARWAAAAKDEATRALDLDDDLAEAHEARAAVARYTEFDWAVTMDESMRAIALNPSLELPHYYRAAAAFHLGLIDVTTAEAQRGLEINPTRPVEALRLLGIAAFVSGDYGRAARYLEEVARRTDISDYYLGLAYRYLGREAEGEAVLAALGGGATRQLRARAAYASIIAVRRRDEAARILAELTRERDLDHHVAYSIGAAFAQSGDAAAAVRWLEQSVNSGFPCAPWFHRDPLLDPIRDDATFKKLLERLDDRERSARKTFGS